MDSWSSFPFQDQILRSLIRFLWFDQIFFDFNKIFWKTIEIFRGWRIFFCLDRFFHLPIYFCPDGLSKSLARFLWVGWEFEYLRRNIIEYLRSLAWFLWVGQIFFWFQRHFLKSYRNFPGLTHFLCLNRFFQIPARCISVPTSCLGVCPVFLGRWEFLYLWRNIPESRQVVFCFRWDFSEICADRCCLSPARLIYVQTSCLSGYVFLVGSSFISPTKFLE